MRGVHGVNQCKRLNGTVPLIINHCTDWERTLPWPRVAVITKPTLPDFIMDTSMMKALGIVLDLNQLGAHYLLDSATTTDSRRGELPLRPPDALVAAISQHLATSRVGGGRATPFRPRSTFFFVSD